MENIDEYIAAQDAKEQVYRLTIENMYLRENISKLADQLNTLLASTSASSK
jgi:hypothetical protein